MSSIRKYRADCYHLTRRAMPKGWEEQPVEIRIEYRCPKDSTGYIARDVQNAIAALKAGIDGIVDAGVMKNDSRAHLYWGPFRLLTRADELGGRKPGVTVIVRALAP